MEATGLSLGKSVLDGALGYAKSAAAEEVALQLGIQRDHAFIRDELAMMQAFLRAAHGERDDHEVLMTWVKQVRDVAYDAEDCIQDFSIHLKKPSWWRLPSTLLERRHIAKQMKDLRARVEDVSQRNLRYQLIKRGGSKPETTAELSSNKAAAIFGIDEARRAAKHDKPKEDLVDLINQEGKDLRVIAVWGTSGDLGQTTIINTAYENPIIKKKFPCRAWVRVFHPFNPNDFIQSLVKQFRSAMGINVLLETEKTGKELAKEFTRYISENSYLIVLNDLSTVEDWNGIKACHPNHKKGSRIIVCSPEVEVASLCAGQESQAMELKQLSIDQTIYAFYEKVFKEAKDLDKHPELIKEAKMILKKCNGLPLAIVTIGGFLAKQPKVAVEWRKLNEHISAELEMNPELGAIKTILGKSYDGLPYHLKSCFLYTSIFPEDYKISRRRLIRQWSAEGYSREIRDKSPEEVADNYFMELIERSMILPSQLSVNSRKGIDSCQVHDLMHEISISKSTEENLIFGMEEGCSSNTQGTIRHLFVSTNWKGDKSEFGSTVDLSRIRSLTVFGKCRSFFISDKMRFLRVLDLEGTSGLVDHHLKHTGKLLHLRYLSLRGCDIFHLSDSLGNLKQLETLDITQTLILKLPKTITKLKKLQYLRAGFLDQDDDSVYNQFEALPKVMNNKPCICLGLFLGFCVACCAPHFVSKEVLEMNGDMNRCDVCTCCCCIIFPFLMASQRPTWMPRGIGKLKAMRTLGIVNIAWNKAILRDIKRLTQLRKLAVTGIKENSQEFCSVVANLSCLESLLVQARGMPGLHGCLDGLTSAPKNLQSLKLYGNLVKLPGWVQGLLNLVKLVLRSSRILEHETAFQVLGKLPNLVSLRLYAKSFQGEDLRFTFHPEAFRSLTVLELNDIDGLKSVEFEEVASLKKPTQGCFLGYHCSRASRNLCWTTKLTRTTSWKTCSASLPAIEMDPF